MLAKRMMVLLDLESEEVKEDDESFLEALLLDYIVLTR